MKFGYYSENTSTTREQTEISENCIIIVKLNVTENFRPERIEGKRNICPQIHEGFSVGRSITLILMSFRWIYQDKKLKVSRRIFQLGIRQNFLTIRAAQL